MTHAITLRNLTKSFRTQASSAPSLLGAVRGLVSAKSREVRARDDISFDIQQGERVAFIGPSGAGKSTTLRILRAKFVTHKRVTLFSDQPTLELSCPGVRLLSRDRHKVSFEVDVRITAVAQLVQAALERATLRQLTVEDPPLEQVIQAIYESATPKEPEARRTAS